MLLRLKAFVFVCLFALGGSAAQGQTIDYLKHGKYFCLCSYKLDCSYCKSCNQERYAVKINNNQSKKITDVFVAYYSQANNRIEEKEAEVAIAIDPQETGIAYVCIPNSRNWIISKIIYADGSSQSFVLNDRMEQFHQDVDECDCND